MGVYTNLTALTPLTAEKTAAYAVGQDFAGELKTAIEGTNCTKKA